MKNVVLLSIIFVFFILFDVYYISHSLRPFSWDEAQHLLDTLDMFELLQKGDYSVLIKNNSNYPPLYSLTTIPVLLFSKFPPYPIFVNFLYYAILVVSLFIFTSHYFNHKAGILAVVIVSVIPQVVQYKRMYMLDFPLLAMVTASCSYIVKSNGFLIKKYVIISAVISALTILTKHYAVVYIYPFCIMNIIFHRVHTKRQILNLLIFSLIMGVVPVIWYICNNSYLSVDLLNKLTFGVLRGQSNTLIASGLYYLQELLFLHTATIIVLSIFSGIFLFIVKESRRTLLLLIFTILVPFVLFILFPTKDHRLLLPLVPFFIVILTGGISKIKTLLFQRIIVILIIVYSIGSISSQTFALAGF